MLATFDGIALAFSFAYCTDVIYYQSPQALQGAHEQSLFVELKDVQYILCQQCEKLPESERSSTFVTNNPLLLTPVCHCAASSLAKRVETCNRRLPLPTSRTQSLLPTLTAHRLHSCTRRV